MQNSKSEYLQLIDYINNNSNGKSSTKKIDKKEITIEKILSKTEIDSRLKSFFNIGHLQNIDTFRNYISTTIRSEIVEEKQFKKSFFLCSEIVGCHRKVFYEFENYECSITDKSLDIHIRYLMKTNFRNILLELCNFEKNQIFINYNDKIKDMIPAIQNNIMIDFNCYDFLNKDIYLLKAIIHNNKKDFGDKIKIVKIISFGNTFDDIKIDEFDISSDDIKILEQLNILRNKLNVKNIPNMTSNDNNCIGCQYKKFCDTKEIKLEKKIKIKKPDGTSEKKYVKLRNTFLF